MSVDIDKIPAELKERPQWVVWKAVTRGGRTTKVPFQVNGRKAKPNDPNTWTHFDAVAVLSRNFAGIGFMFSPDDEFFGIDLDACRNPESGELTDWAQEVVNDFQTYTEVSPSLAGLKLVARGRFPDKLRTGKGTGRAKRLKGKKSFSDKSPEIAAFDRERFFTFTGQQLDGTPSTVNDCQAALDALCTRYWDKNGTPKKRSKSARPKVAPSEELDVLIARCSTASDRSEADFELCCIAIERSWSKDDVWDRVKGVGKFAERGRDYFDMTWAAAAERTTPKKEPKSVTNYYLEEYENESGEIVEAKVPYRMPVILSFVRKLTGDFPRRVENALFVDDRQHGFGWLTGESGLFGYFHSKAGVDWRRGPAFVAKPVLYAELQRTATRYDAVEVFPHEPQIATHYYACNDVKSGSGDHLRQLLDRFNPSTEIDRDLIQAALMTPGWGGPPGSRPCFVVTSDAGRGAGKTTLAELIGRVWGGVMSFSHREDINKIKTRLLTSDVLTRRVCLLDNVKSLKFSWSELEAMITANVIGGHRLYVGEATRPNTLTWFITLNGANLSTDMAQRSVIIKIDKPKRSGEWSDLTQEFIDNNRLSIIEDIVGALRSEPHPLERFTRWATWERAVLSRLPEPADAQLTIAERQVGVDVEAEEAGHLEEHFASELRSYGYDIEREWVFIPSRIAHRWYSDATNDRTTTSAVVRILKQMITEGRLNRLQEHRTNRARGVLWTANGLCVAVALDLEQRIATRLADQGQ